jgi:hypothetical protein
VNSHQPWRVDRADDVHLLSGVLPLSTKVERIITRPLGSVSFRSTRKSDVVSDAAADFAHAAAELPAQQRSQSHAFGIADFGGDLVDTGVYFD